MQEKITPNTEVSISELAAILNITARRVRQLTEDGILERSGRGRYKLCASVQKYVYQTHHEYSEDEATVNRAKLEAETLLKASKAKIASMEAQELEGKMHRSEDVAAMTEDLIYEIRGALIALPGRLAVDVAACSSAAEAAEIVRREAYQIMGELAGYQYDPDKYAERVRERMNWDAEVEEQD